MATQGFKARQSIRDAQLEAARLLSQPAINQTFGELQGLFGGTLNSLLSRQALSGQIASRGVQSNLGRLGLGQTGLGQALGAGIRTGSTFQGNLLRAQSFQQLLQQAFNLQQQRANIPLAGLNAFAATGQEQGGGILGGIGQAASTFASLFPGGAQSFNAGQQAQQGNFTPPLLQ